MRRVPIFAVVTLLGTAALPADSAASRSLWNKFPVPDTER
jgi:hypothetical protein